MDGQLDPRRLPAAPPVSASEAKQWQHGAMQSEAPLEMPTQDPRLTPQHAPAIHQPLRTWVARLIAMSVTLGISAYGTVEMIATVGFGNMTALQAVMILFFAISLSWIALTVGSTISGLLTIAVRQPNAALQGSRTALLMPVYNEDPLRTTAALQAMAEALAAAGAAQHFEIVILSDSTHVDAWIAESLAVDRLRRNLATTLPVRYRRRWRNTGRKVGNIEDFVKRWGGHYDYMIVLDADSLMSAATLVTLTERMQADPQLGILQTVPALAGQTSLYARMQQFAGRVYGPILARGLAAWSGEDGNYWGHNAIIRVRAFAQACGLPQLPGRKPFGGHVLSHDFIEAAFIRRAGWKVRIAANLGGSWEEGPPSLSDTAVRDRRWAQGNLQHLRLIGTAGLTWTSRLHLGMGIMSYLAAPLWLMLILIGFALTLQAAFVRPEYFSKKFQLFPDWPVFDAQRMLLLFLFSMVILFTPRVIALIRSLLVRETRRGCGGIIGLPISALIELVLSALYAPVMMLIQTQHVISILAGRDTGWIAQQRQAQVISWREAAQWHWKHSLIGVATGGIALLLSPTLLAWLSPAIAGLILAIPLSKLSGSVRAGNLLARLGLLRIPEERTVPEVLRRRDELLREAAPLPTDGLKHLASHANARFLQITGNLPRPTEPRGQPSSHRLTAAHKLMQAQNLSEALTWLSPPERMEIAADARLLNRLAQLHAADEHWLEAQAHSVSDHHENGSVGRRDEHH